MKKIFFILSMTLLLSCEKEEEYITFTILNNGFNFDETTLSVDYTIVAPGRVNIQDHGVEYEDINIPPTSGRVSFGPLKQSGVFHGEVNGLAMGTSYKFRIYAESDGKRIYTKEYTGITSTPAKIHF